MSEKHAPQRTRIFLVRHGVTDQTGKLLYGHTKGISLNEEGKKQAELLSRFLGSTNIDAIYSSPLERAYETAQIIARNRGLSIEVDDELIDTNVGDWTNMKLEDCSNLEDWKQVQDSPSEFCFPGGESFMDLNNRINKSVQDIAQKHRGKNVLIASHRDPIIAVLAKYLGVSLDLFQRIPCAPASLSELEYVKDEGFVASVNVLPAERMI